MSLVILGIVLFYAFYKLVEMDDGGADDGIDDFIAMRDSSSIARGDDPLNPEAQWQSITDPLDIFGDD